MVPIIPDDKNKTFFQEQKSNEIEADTAKSLNAESSQTGNIPSIDKISTNKNEQENITSYPSDTIEPNESEYKMKFKLNRIHPSLQKSTIIFNKTKRFPLLQEALILFNNYKNHVKDIDGPRFYKLLKDKINEIWPFINEEEYFGILLSTFESILFLNNWKEINENQILFLSNLLKKIINDNVVLEDIMDISKSLERTGLKFVPYEEKET